MKRKGPKPSFEVMGDGREICLGTPKGRLEYESRRLAMWLRDDGRCCLCGLPIDPHLATFEHKRSKGMGRGFRDDRIEKNGVSHYWGNMAKGSISFDRYMKKSIEERIKNCHQEIIP